MECMLQFRESPEWFARGFRQLRTLQEPIRCGPALGLQHCAICGLPVTGLSCDLRTIKPCEPDHVVIVPFLVSTANSPLAKHTLHPRVTHPIPKAVRRMLRIGSRTLNAGSVASNLADKAPESSRNGRGRGAMDIELIKSTSWSICRFKTDW